MPGDIGLPGILPFLGYFSQISVGAEQISTSSKVKSFVVRVRPALSFGISAYINEALMRVAFRNPSEYAGDLRKSQLELTVHSC